MKQFEAGRIGGSIENTYFDGRDYWVKGLRDEWQYLGKGDVVLRLKEDKGLLGHPRRGENASEVDAALHNIQSQHRIDCAAPLVHRPKKALSK